MATSQPWFGRKPTSFGWRPLTWQGWFVTLALVAAVLISFHDLHGIGTRIIVVIFAVITYLVIVRMTGTNANGSGGGPGGPAAT